MALNMTGPCPPKKSRRLSAPLASAWRWGRARAELGRDIASAYIASAARVGSWAVISAFVYRASAADYAMLALVRATIGILNYTSLGLAPVMTRILAASGAGQLTDPPLATTPPRDTAVRTAYSNGIIVAGLTALLGLLVTCAYAHWCSRLLHLPADPRWVRSMPMLVMLMGIGTVLRLAGDAPGAVLQTQRRIGLDNDLISLGEGIWVALFILVGWRAGNFGIGTAATAYAVSGAAPLLFRGLAAAKMTRLVLPDFRKVSGSIIGMLLASGGMITLAQLADYLYAPIDYILINRYLDPVVDAAAYAPAVLIASALLLVVSGLASALLPRAAVAHASGDREAVRRYYVHGTLVSTALLILASLVTWATLPWLLRAWLRDPMPGTIRIMPLMLVAAVLGGSGAVGRSILLGVGRVWPFTASVLLAGAANVILSFVFVRWFNLGLPGIILGTVLATAARCGVWMPWYVLRTLKREAPIAPAPLAWEGGRVE